MALQSDDVGSQLIWVWDPWFRDNSFFHGPQLWVMSFPSWFQLPVDCLPYRDFGSSHSLWAICLSETFRINLNDFQIDPVLCCTAPGLQHPSQYNMVRYGPADPTSPWNRFEKINSMLVQYFYALADNAPESLSLSLSRVPEEYHDLWEVFSKAR